MKILIEIIGMALVLAGFMYSNPSWTINGFMIIIAGIIILILGIILRIIFRYKLKHKK